MTIKKHRIPDNSQDVFTILVRVTDPIYSQQFEYEELIATLQDAKKRRYIVSCTPFIIYGINKGDVVEVDRQNIVKKVVADGGCYGYRIAYARTSTHDDHIFNKKVLDDIRGKGYEVEEDSVLMSAVNAKNADDAVRLEGILRELISKGVLVGFDTIR